MDETSNKILAKIGIQLENINNEILIPRETLLSDNVYESVKEFIPELKKVYSSSTMTCLHSGADIAQRWPLLNLVRQILHVYGFQMKPIRKSDGYTKEGVKKFKRFFLITKAPDKEGDKEGDKEEKEEEGLDEEQIEEPYNPL